jgi:Coenzyme PQQ synthesis protein D (PqqD)
MKNAIVARGTRVAARKVAGEMVILSADDSSLYVLNDLGTAVWEAVDGRTPLSAIVDAVVCREYDVDRESALRDLQEFVDGLVSHGVLAEVS